MSKSIASMSGEKTSVSFFSSIEQYLAEFVYGGMDGAVTTFAVVAAATGGGLPSSVILILGIANLLADGVSMSVGNYLSTKAEQQQYHQKHQWMMKQLVRYPDSYIVQTVDILQEKNLSPHEIQCQISMYHNHLDQWATFFLLEQEKMVYEQIAPHKTALATFISFVVVGSIPLCAYVLDAVGDVFNNKGLFIWSCVFTCVAFTAIGFSKHHVTQTGLVRSIIESLGLGLIAAVLSYFVGDVLARMFT